MAITSTPNPKKASAQKSSSARKNKENMGSQLEPSQQGKNPGAYQHKARSSTSGPASVQSKKLEEQLKKLSLELSVEKKKREAAEKALTQRVKYKSTMTEKIIKPKGSAGSQTKGYSLIHAMGLEGDREKYRLFQRYVRQWVLNAGMDPTITIRYQPRELIIKVCKVACDTFEYLGKFQNDWATVDLIAQYLSNHRKYAVKQGFLDMKTTGRTDEDPDENIVDSENNNSGNGEDNENSEAEGDEGEDAEVNEDDGGELEYN